MKKLTTLFSGLDAEGVSQTVDDAIVRMLNNNTSLIQSNAMDINRPLEGGKTFLHYAAAARRTGIVKVLLGLGATVNAADDNGETPLHAACQNYVSTSQPLLTLLLDAGANVKVHSYLKNQTPVDLLTKDDDKRWMMEYHREVAAAQLPTNKQFLTNKFLSNALGNNSPARSPAAGGRSSSPTLLSPAGKMAATPSKSVHTRHISRCHTFQLLHAD